MFVSYTRVKNLGQPLENAPIIGEEMLRWLRETEGFEGFMILSREDHSIGLTFWQSREVAERHRVARMEFLEKMMAVAQVEIEEILDYDLMFADLGPLTADVVT
jgi:hypothetical protein